MKTMITFLAFAASLTLFALSAPAANEPVKADNTAVNARDAEGKTVTPADQAKGSKGDVEVTRKIREQLMKESGFSVDAQNVKIITLKGLVSLRGPVKTEEEKQRIGQIAGSIAGNQSVRNELQVKE
jgi:osmotically-inducible protein OsmY